MRRAQRLRRSQDFQGVIRAGRAVSGSCLVLYYSLRDEGSGAPRFGFAVSRRVGGAVQRNRVKRVLREAARSLSSDSEEPADVVVVARPRAAAVEPAELRTELGDALGRARTGSEGGTR